MIWARWRGEALGRDGFFRFGDGVDAHFLEPARKRGEPQTAFGACLQMGMRDRLPLSGGIGPELGELLVVEMLPWCPAGHAADYGHVHFSLVDPAPSPSSTRSFRIARNRCTRTVDSFNPVIALTSREVHPS